MINSSSVLWMHAHVYRQACIMHQRSGDNFQESVVDFCFCRGEVSFAVSAV